MRILLFVTLIATACSAASIEQILSAPFPSDLTVHGGHVAWVLNERGARNLWVAEAPGYQGRRLTAYQEDNGQEIGHIAWTPDGQAVVFTRGGDLEMQREVPNPQDLAAGVEQAIWIAPLQGEVRKLAEGHSPAVSPAGDRVAFLKGGQIWSVGLQPGDKPAHWIHVRGQASALRWSPDGKMLAFVSGRRDHAFIAVYQVGGQTVRLVDPSVDTDGQPTWSPDSKRIAFLRIPASRREFMFGPVREAQPFSIRVVSASGGDGKEVWRATPGVGSAFHPVVAENQILWGDGDRLVFPWEGSGWVHLYSVSANGGEAAELTPGAFEVEHVSVSDDRKTVVYSSNQDDIDRRHIWRSGVAAGSKAVAVTQGAGLEWSPAVVAGGIVMLRSGTREPARAVFRAESGETRDLAPGAIPANFPMADLVEPQQVVFSAADGMQIHGQLFLPKDYKAGERRGALIFFHGGSRRQMLLGWHYMYYYNNSYAMNQYLASLGYVVLSVNYRSGIGYGMHFREALNYGATGASEFNDVMGSGLYLRSRSDVDPKRIGVWGGSYGGYLTAMALARASDLFAAGVDFHGVHDWNAVIRNFLPAYDPQKQQDAARLAFESSPMSSVTTWRSPVLLIHGDDDRNVPFSETVDLAVALRKQKVEFEQLIFPDDVHDFLLVRNWLRAYESTADFFARKLPAR